MILSRSDPWHVWKCEKRRERESGGSMEGGEEEREGMVGDERGK